MPPGRHPSSPEIPALEAEIRLAIREELDRALFPIANDIHSIKERLGKGDTDFALLGHRVGALEKNREPTTDKNSKSGVRHIGEMVSVSAIVKILGAIALLAAAFLGGKALP